MDKPWTYSRRVRYYETDRMGVVHHSNYLRLLEDARMDWIGDNVMPYREMEALGIVIPCVSAQGNFKAFLRFDDPCSVSLRLVEFTGVRIRFCYEVRNEDTDQLCYDGVTEHYFSRDGDYHPISLKKQYPELYRRFESLVQA